MVEMHEAIAGHAHRITGLNKDMAVLPRGLFGWGFARQCNTGHYDLFILVVYCSIGGQQLLLRGRLW